MSKPSNRIEVFKKKVKGSGSEHPKDDSSKAFSEEKPEKPSLKEDSASNRGAQDDSLIESIALNSNIGEVKKDEHSSKRKKVSSDPSSSSKKKKKHKGSDEDQSDDFELDPKMKKQKRKSLQDITNFIQEKSLLMKKGKSSKSVSNQKKTSSVSATDENEEPTSTLNSTRTEQSSSRSIEEKIPKDKTPKKSKYKQLLQQELMKQAKKKTYKTQYEQFVTEEVGKISEEIVSSSIQFFGTNQTELLDTSMHESLSDGQKAVSLVENLTKKEFPPPGQEVSIQRTDSTSPKADSPLLDLGDESFTLPKFVSHPPSSSSSNHDDSLNLGDLMQSSASPFSLRYNVFFKD
ncbi:hypothetical protein FDP41_006770 [Naegleria fowleri]|uniref:Uncharacterized protein n=1 Tax=Naegleria fowleri TaxID=5763 RepID=A0A6A5BJG6_NAEFO|nr:uncharacterized protein FDP41_006770 [Naegleria fowleri]KAF0974160.1 hypothetical protein FDP41_006770 [Naegleria fowleri]